jgi:hypothetical protein
MHRSLTQRLNAFLCLMAFGLGQTLFASMGVRCTDASGDTRIEYVCIKTSQGACLTPCVDPAVHAADDNHESDDVPPTPCEDEPLSSQAAVAKSIPSSVSLQPVIAAVLVAILSDHWSFTTSQPVSPRHPEVDRDRPPDSLAHLRSVILIV